MGCKQRIISYNRICFITKYNGALFFMEGINTTTSPGLNVGNWFVVPIETVFQSIPGHRREGEREEQRWMAVKQPPPAPTASAVEQGPTIVQIVTVLEV